MIDLSKYTKEQRQVITSDSSNMLVSASAGTGKTTVMIERIVSLINSGADVSDFVVVTFTNLAAAEMKSRLAQKLSDNKSDLRIADQLERIDFANISTLHSFCSELLRNYFYVVDIDPSFVILDDILVSNLRKNAMSEVIRQYFDSNDEMFNQVYKIFATKRKEETFVDVIMSIYNFSRCINNFDAWYESTRKYYTEQGNNVIFNIILDEISANIKYIADNMGVLYNNACELGLEFADVFKRNQQLLNDIDLSSLQNVLDSLGRLALEPIPRANKNRDFGVDKKIETILRDNYAVLKKQIDTLREKYCTKLSRGERLSTLWEEMQLSVKHVDKLVEISNTFGEVFYQTKKQRGGLDFNDLEHLTLQLFEDDQTRDAICSRYKYIFVDEYQDTNPMQEAIISALSQRANLFMVGDVKQSIYGFRGCEPEIFVNKYNYYKANNVGNVYELNKNFRSNKDILSFVNNIFNTLMTTEFGKVDYKGTSLLEGDTKRTLQLPSVTVDFVLQPPSAEKKDVDKMYDITEVFEEDSDLKQCDQVVARIKQYVGKGYTDSNGNKQNIGYGDIVILMRSLKTQAVNIYNALVRNNIPVVANFKVEGYANKEVRELINFLRVIDNPYNDVYLVGSCLSTLGNFTANELGIIRVATADWIPFYDRLKMYMQSNNNELSRKISTFVDFVNNVRFVSRSASVCEVILKVLELTDYELYVEGLPNGSMRLHKLYNFIDSIKDVSYAQTVDKFLNYLDETDNVGSDESISDTNAVRIMTMHASKGLEFPIVIVAGTETKFNMDKGNIERNFNLGIATRYYNLETMRSAHTLGDVACGLCSRNKQLEEQMRLLYVALTRAKFVLNVIGTTSQKKLDELPSLPRSANSHLDWIIYALKNNYENLCVDNDSLQINTINEVTTDIVTQSNPLCEQETDLQQVLDKMNYVYPYQSQTDMPLKVVSSQLDSEYLALDDSKVNVIINNGNRNFIGTAYHKVYQYVDYNAGIEQIKLTVDGLIAENLIDKQYAEQLDLQLIYNTLNNEELRKITSCGTVYREKPFMLYAPYNSISKEQRFTDNVMLQGVIDLLVVQDNKAVVVDFKYTTKSAELIEQSYRYQLNSYRYAVQQICGITDVDCYVLSIADNKLIKLN